MTNIDNSQNMLDVREIIARVEELEDLLATMSEADAAKDKLNPAAATETVSDEYHNLHCEHLVLAKLLDDMKGNGGDEEWRGDWYPVTLIRDDYFETAMDELIEDIGVLPNLPSYLKVTVDYDALQMDYTSVDYDGVTYWYR